MIFLASIVEGYGEVEALPPLLHRVASAEGLRGQLVLNPPIRVKAGSFLNDEAYRNKQLVLASAKAAERNGGVLVLIDCEDECPAELGPQLYRQAQAVLRDDIPIMISIAYREYESWFLAAAHSLGGRRGIPSDIESPGNSESIRGAKEWLSRRMDCSYDPIIHQAEFSRIMDLAEARSNRSFDRFYRRLAELFLKLNDKQA